MWICDKDSLKVQPKWVCFSHLRVDFVSLFILPRWKVNPWDSSWNLHYTLSLSLSLSLSILFPFIFGFASKMERKWPAIGIDLGTTYSCAGVWQTQQDRVEIIPNDLGNHTTPSWVAFTSTHRLIGESAKNQAGVNPSNTIFGQSQIILLSFFPVVVSGVLCDATVDTYFWTLPSF